MAKELSSVIQSQISNKYIKPTFIFKINGVDYSDYLINWQVSYSREFGSASATFTLNNNDGRFGSGGSAKIEVGDIVELIEKYEGDTTEWKSFYGQVTQRSITKTATERSITINCLDYISTLQFWDIDLEVEGEKVEITEETLTPNYLPAPNDNLAQIFDFANDSIAEDPAPIILIKDKNHGTDDLQNDGFEVRYQTGQLVLGSPINAKYNYDIIARSYWTYVNGVYIEDILEDILTQPDGYGGYLFGESSAQDVIDNHLTTTFLAEEGKTEDTLTPNTTATTITIKHKLASAVSEGDTSITLESVDGLPNSGQAEICGDVFTWSSIGSGNTLQGIPSSGDYALKAHPVDAYVEYEETYDAGQVWYLTYSNIITDLTSSDFQLPSGVSIKYIDKRFGRIILDSPISTSSTVKCITNYSFKTLQASGIQLNKISFKSREVENRFEAINILRDYVAPNYIIRTQGDNKIWAGYLSQKTTADYTLNLVTNVNYMEDEDLYTRVVFYGKNKNPTNIMFGDNVDFVTTGETYKSLASNVLLSYDSEEDNYYVYKTTISNAGYIDLENIKPIVYINGVPVDDHLHRMVALPVQTEVTTRTVTRSGCHGISKESYTKVHTYYYYKVKLPHQNIEPSQPIYFYDATGTLVKTLSAYDLNMDYARGIWNVPGDERNSVVESISTATYWVFYATHEIEIDYDNVLFKISKDLIPNPDQVEVRATFEYWSVMTAVEDIAAIVDGRWDTQVQTEFFAEPPTGYNYAIVDLGATYNIQAIDIVAGFYKPDDIRKFDVDFRFTLQYSTDGTNFYTISDATHNVRLTSGEHVSFEEDDLGVGFEARYLKIVLEDVKKLEYGDGVWVVAFSEISAYADIVLKSEATLIRTTKLTADVNAGDTTIYVESTEGFTDPDSGSTATAYINGTAFTYTGLTSTSFVGCTLPSGFTATEGTRVTTAVEGDTTLYDDNNLLGKLGDRVYKEIKIDDNYLFTQTELDRLAKAYLKEFYKDHSKLSVDVLYQPFLKVGQTVHLTDTYNNIDTNYFIESITDNRGVFSLVLARYPE